MKFMISKFVQNMLLLLFLLLYKNNVLCNHNGEILQNGFFACNKIFDTKLYLNILIIVWIPLLGLVQ